MLCYIHGKTDGKLFNFYNLKDMLLQEATMSLFTKLNTRPTTLHRLFKTELLNIANVAFHEEKLVSSNECIQFKIQD